MLYRFLLASGMAFLVLGSLPVYAVDLNAELSTKGVVEKPVFRFVETAFVDYHEGGNIQDQLSGKNTTLSFSADSTNPSVKELISQVNSYLSQTLKSQTKVTEMSLEYNASLVGGSNYATIDYNLVLRPVISNYVVSNSGDTTMLDAQWIGLSLNGPVIIKTAKYGELDVSKLDSFLHKAAPNLEIDDSHAKQLLAAGLLDSSTLVQQPVSNWQYMFDPAYIITETSGWGYNGSKIPITTFTIGESRLGVAQNTVTSTADFVMDKKYQIQTIQHASSATVQVDGQATITLLSGQMVFASTPQAINNNPLPSTGLSVQMIYAMAGFGSAIAVGIFAWSNKKMKESLKKEKDITSPIVFEYEERRHWADRFDTNKSVPDNV